MRNALGALLLFAAAPALAEKLAILPFTGPDAAAVRQQISDGLCDASTCVQPGTVAKGPKPDWAKVKKQKVDFVITGAIKGKGAKKSLELQVLTKAGPPKMKKAVAFSTNDLGPRALETALEALNKAMGLSAAAPAAETKKQPEPEPEAAPAKKEPEPEATPSKKEPEAAAKKEPEAPPPPPPEDARSSDDQPPPDSKKAKNPIVEVEAGVELFSRNFSYNQVNTPNLRSYSASFIVAPEARVEFYPLALLTTSALAGLGIDGAYGQAVGLKSRRTGTSVTWGTNLSHYDFSVRFRIKPVSSVDAAIIPFVGLSNRSFSVGLGSDGSTLDGLPGVSYTAIRPGIVGELPFGQSGFSVFAKFAVMIVLSSGEILGPKSSYFTKGGNFGLEGQLGVGFRLIGPLQIRAAVDFTRYGLSFSTTATDTYQAVGAVDQYIGGNLALRLIF